MAREGRGWDGDEHGERVGDAHEVGVGLPLPGSAPGWVTPKPSYPLMVAIRKLQQAAAWPWGVGMPQNPRSPLLQGTTVLDDRETEEPDNGQQWLPFPTSWCEDTLDLRQRTVWTLWGGE